MGLFDRLKGRVAPAPVPAAAADDAETARQAGNAALQAGRLDEALVHYDRFVATRPQHAPAHLNRGFVLMQLQRLPEAAAELRRAAALDAASHEAHFFLGRALLAAADLAGAERALDECVRLKPDFVHGWVELGLVREQRAAFAPARQAFERAAELEGDAAAAWEGVTRVALRQGDGSAALAAAERNVAIADTPVAQGLRAEALLLLGRAAEALGLAESALARAPQLPRLHLLRAGALHRLARFDDAICAYEQLLQRFPEASEGLVGLGTALVDGGRFEKALPILERAIAFAPHDVVAINNRAQALMQLLRFDDATAVLEAGLRTVPGDAHLRFALANAVLSRGDLAQGWRLYESRPMAQVSGAPRWQPGMAVAGKRVLLLSEQGLGDAVQFARYVPEVMALGARVVLQVSPRVKPLVDGVWPGCEVVSEPAAAGRVDLFCPLLSLPFVLGRPEPLSMSAPYIRADAARREFWRERIRGGREPAVGIVWSGSPSHPDDRRRSMPLELLRAAAPEEGVRFVSLQLEVRDSDREALGRWPELLHIGSEQRDLADTAALIEALDAVLCVDTSVGHVAGALGRPLLLMLQRRCDWRWGLHGETTPWYPSARLLRQPAPGDWAAVVGQAMAEIRRLTPSEPGRN